MARAWIIGCLAAGVAVALLMWTDDGSEQPPQTLDADDLGSEGTGAGGGLLTGRASEPPSQTDVSAPLPAEPIQTGPYEFYAYSMETDAPLAGVLIETEEEEERIGTTGPDGRLRVEDAGAPDFMIRATLAGHVPTRAHARAGDLTGLPLQPGISIAGQVVFGRGAPAPHAKLRVWDVDLGREIATLQADEEGHFTIPAVRPNRPFLVVTSVVGFVPQRRTESFDVSIKDLEIRVGENGRALVGQVTDAKGVPLAEQEVHLLRVGEALPRYRRPVRPGSNALPGLAEARSARTVTDEDGRYAFRGIPFGDAVQPVVELSPRFEARGKPARFRKEEMTIERDILVPEPASLRIHVQDDAGHYLRHARVQVRAGAALWQIAKGDRQADGSLLLEDVTPTTCTVLASIPAAPPPPDPPEPIELRPAHEETAYVVFPRGVSLTGRVLNKRGDPIWQAAVSWRSNDEKESAATVTDGRGTFRLQRLAGTPGTVCVTARDVPYAELGYEGQCIENVAPGPRQIEIVLKDGTRVRGRFPELPKDALLQSALVPGSAADAGTLWLDKQRRFSRRGPPKGSDGMLVFHTPGYPPVLHVFRSPFGSEEDRDLGDLDFRASDPFQGQILDPWGKPIRAAKVTLAPAWGQGRSQRTDRDGAFEFSRLPENDVLVHVEARGFPLNRAVLKPASQRVRQVIRLDNDGYLLLTMVNRHKDAVADAEVAYQPVADHDKRSRRNLEKTKTDTKGKVKLRLRPGTYVVAARSRRGGLVGEMRVTIRAGETERKTFVLESWYERYVAQKRKEQLEAAKRKAQAEQGKK